MFEEPAWLKEPKPEPNKWFPKKILSEDTFPIPAIIGLAGYGVLNMLRAREHIDEIASQI